MAGGTWSPTEQKVRPGFYMNFVAAAIAAIQPGARGIVAVPVKAHWGPVKEFVEITRESEVIENYTEDMSSGATAYDIIRFILLGGAQKVLAYRITDGTEAKASITLQDDSAANVLKLEGLYPGARGNNFKVTVLDNPVDSANKKDIILYEGTTELYTFTFDKGASIVDNAVSAINNDSNNIWITATKMASGDGTLADVTDQSLSGGASGIAGITNTEYTNALSAFETVEFNILTLDGQTDSALQTSVVSWVDRVRSEGKKVLCVLGGSSADDQDPATGNSRSEGFNHEAVINVIVGVELDSQSYNSAQTAPYIAGLIAGQRLRESITYAATPFDDVTYRMTHSEVVAALQSGSLVLVHDGEKVKVEAGINTLSSLGADQNDQWKKIRTIRVMDAINNDLLKTAQDNYIGKVNNDEDGRVALIAAFKNYMEQLVAGGVIADDFDVYLDPDYHGDNATKTPGADEVYVIWEARILDSMEKIFGQFIVQ